METDFVRWNMFAAWALMLGGCLTGAIIGLGFHKQDFLGGYNSFPRRLMRLGHIAFFGLAMLNFFFAVTVREGFASGEYLIYGSRALIVGAVAMPLVCFLSAWREYFRHAFFVPVSGIVLGVCAILRGMLQL